jgi:hypothetical protein
MGYQYRNYDDSGEGSIMNDADSGPTREAPREVESFLDDH